MRLATLAVILAATPATAHAHPCEAKVAELTDLIYGKIKPALDKRRAMDRMALTVPSLAESARESIRQADQDEAMYLGMLQQERQQCEAAVAEERRAAAEQKPAAKKKAPRTSGCAKDTDCKGERICVSGACVDPPPKKKGDTTL